MLFGFKTKKDKRIEELEKLVDYLMHQQPKITSEERQIVTLRRNQILEPGVDPEFAKQIVAKRYGEDLRPYIRFEVVTSPSENRVLQAKLDVVSFLGGSV